MQLSGSESLFNSEMLSDIFKKLPKRFKLDVDNNCLVMLSYIHEKHPGKFCSLFHRFVLEPQQAVCSNICGVIFGKESHFPVASECRAILPMSAIWPVGARLDEIRE